MPVSSDMDKSEENNYSEMDKKGKFAIGCLVGFVILGSILLAILILKYGI